MTDEEVNSGNMEQIDGQEHGRGILLKVYVPQKKLIWSNCEKTCWLLQSELSENDHEPSLQQLALKVHWRRAQSGDGRLFKPGYFKACNNLNIPLLQLTIERLSQLDLVVWQNVFKTNRLWKCLCPSQINLSTRKKTFQPEAKMTFYRAAQTLVKLCQICSAHPRTRPPCWQSFTLAKGGLALTKHNLCSQLQQWLRKLCCSSMTSSPSNLNIVQCIALFG